MMIQHPWLSESYVFLAAAINILGYSFCAIEAAKGRVAPNRVSWFLWFLAPMIAFIAQCAQGVWPSSLMTLMTSLGPLAIFIASFLNPNAIYRVTRLDQICGLLSLAGLVLWGLTNDGNLAIFFGILADGFAGIPIVLNAYRNPDQENGFVFLCATVSALITLCTVQTFDFEHIAFPVYIVFLCGLITSLIFYPRQKK